MNCNQMDSRFSSSSCHPIDRTHAFRCEQCGHKALYSTLDDDACNECGSDEVVGAQQCCCGEIVVPNGGLSFTQNNGSDVDIETYNCSCGQSWAD